MKTEHRREIAYFLASQDPGGRMLYLVPLKWGPNVYLMRDEVKLEAWWHYPTGHSVWAAISERENVIAVTDNVRDIWAGEKIRVLPPP